MIIKFCKKLFADTKQIQKDIKPSTQKSVSFYKNG